MSLHLLRPVLWPARLMHRTQQLCASVNNKQYLVKGEDFSGPSQGACVIRNIASQPCVLRALYTTAALQNVDSSDTVTNGIVTKIQGAKTAEDLLEVTKNNKLSASEASFALYRLEREHGSTKEKTKQLSKDQRLANLMKGLTHRENVRKLSSRWLVKSLTNPIVWKVKNKQAIVDAIVPALRSKLRAMDVFTLCKLVCNNQMLSTHKHTEDLVKEAARVLELRRREMDELPASILIRLLSATPHFPQSFMTFITDKILESLDKFSFTDLERTTSILAKLHFRSPALLKAITYQALQQRAQWTLDLVLSFLVTFGSLNFYSQPVTQQMATFVQSQDTEWTCATVGAAAMAFRVLRMPQSGLFDVLAEYTLNHLGDFNQYELHKVLYAFGELSYKPKNEKVFYDKVAAKLESEFDTYSPFTQIQLASALMLSDQVPAFVLEGVLQPKEAKENSTDSKTEPSEFLDILQMQLNTHARLACTEYSGPYLEPCGTPKSEAGQGIIEKSVVNTLQIAVGGDQFLKTNVWTNFGYKLDALVLMNEINKPVVIDDYLLPDSSVDESAQDKTPVPPEFSRIAVLTWSPRDMLFEKEELTGRFNMQRRHLQLAGYRLVEVNFKQWNKAKTDFQKLSLINLKLTDAVAGKTQSSV